MPKDNTVSRRVIGNALFAFLTLIAVHAYGQFDFTISTDIPWDEQHGLEGGTGGASLTNLNSRIIRALSDATAANLCYVLSGTPADALVFTTSAASCSAAGISGRRSVSADWLDLKTGEHVDYELGAEQLLTITGYDDAGIARGKFEVNLVITDYDERPLLLQKSSDVFTRYWQPGDSERLLVFDLFEDPEGINVFFDTRAISTDVWICDTANGGDFVIDEVPAVPARTAGQGTTVSFRGGNAATDCSVSNQANPGASPSPAPNPGTRGSGGNRVVSAKITGPFLDIRADSLADDTDGDAIVTDRGVGTYAARVYVRAWSGPTDSPLSATGFAIFDIRVKVGANNPPQFAGGPTGFAVTLVEGDDQTDPMPVWVAGDLDAGGATNDSLTYTLGGTTRKYAYAAGGKISLSEIRGDNPATSETETDFVVAIVLKGKDLDFESASETFEIDLFVTDQWSDPVSVPIHITLIDVNEVDVEDEIEDQQLVNGLSRTFDLNQYFSDPEGDELTFEAFTNLHADIVEVDNDADTLTIHGMYAEAGEGGESTVTVTLIATDSRGTVSEPIEFDVTTRYENLAPSIDLLESAKVVLGANVVEADSAGTVLLPLIAYTDDEPAPTAVLYGHDASLFEAVVDPYLNEEGAICSNGSAECVQQEGKVAVIVGNQDLNFEATSLHELSLMLQDGWQPDLVSKAIGFHVSVHDSNDAPVVIEAREIPDLSVVVQGSTTYQAGIHFADEDGDRLRVYAVSSDEAVVEVNVAGLAQVTFRGLKEGNADVTLTAVDLAGASAELSFTVKVGPNNPPIVDEEAVASQLPQNNVIHVAEFVDIELWSLFSEPDSGDMITSVKAFSSDDDILLAIPTNDGKTSTLVGRASGTATLTITAMDRAENETSIEREITVNAPPEQSTPLDPITLDRTAPLSLDISSVFSDPDHDSNQLVITAEVLGEGVDRVALEVAAMQLTISGVMGASPGDFEIRLTATDPLGSTATSTFVATLINIGPTVALSVESQELDRIHPLVLDVGGVFDDSDGAVQSITASTSDEAIAEISEIDESDTLIIHGLAVGSASITLTATDDNGAYTLVAFDVSVMNIAPIVAEVIPDHTTSRTDDLVIDISSTFDDPDADNALLETTVDVEDSPYVRATLDGTLLTLSGLEVGRSDVTLTTTDADGGTIETSFTTTIENITPVVANSLTPIHLEVGGEGEILSISDCFVDDDPLTYTMTIADANIATAILEGDTVMIAPVSRGATILQVTATDPYGASAVATGSITVSDGQLRAVAAKSLAGFGRTMIASVSSSVGPRVMSDNRSSDLTLDAWAPVDDRNSALVRTMERRRDIDWDIDSAVVADMNSHVETPSGMDTLRSMFGRDFALNLGTSDNRSLWSVWGNVDIQSYEGDGYDGRASSFYFGADVETPGPWLIGVAISNNVGESDYSWGTASQSMDLRLTSVLPYVSYRPTDRIALWSVAGFGTGELETTVLGSDNHMSSLSSHLTMVGASKDLKSTGRLRLAARADAASASLETDEGNGAADDLFTDVTRLRVGIESAFHTEIGQSGMLEPFGKVSLRSDGGDGDIGTGIELVGGVRISGRKISLEAQGRSLATSGEDEYSESGFSLTAKLNQSGNGTGVMMSVTPRWGFDARGNDVLWQNILDLSSITTHRSLSGFGDSGVNRSINAHIAYGLLIANEHYLLTPFIDVASNGLDHREILFGANLRSSVHRTRSFDVNLVLGRIEHRTGAIEGKAGLSTSLTF